MKQETAIQTIRFRFLKPTRFLAGLGEKPKGVEALLPNDAQMRLTVRGERDAVALLVQMIQLADVRSLRYLLRLQLVAYTRAGKRGAMLEKKTLRLENKGAFALVLGGGLAEARGVLHGSPGEIQLAFEAKVFRLQSGRPQPTESLNATRRVPFGKTVEIARFDDPRAPRRRDKKTPIASLVLEASATPEP